MKLRTKSKSNGNRKSLGAEDAGGDEVLGLVVTGKSAAGGGASVTSQPF